MRLIRMRYVRRKQRSDAGRPIDIRFRPSESICIVCDLILYDDIYTIETMRPQP
ncbi:hypothetical protein D3C80_1678490 [compost metagenome]